MPTTLATKKQSKAIRERMAEIRSDLPYDVDLARDRVKQLTDWRYHISRRPLPILLGAIVAGYLVVPAKKRPETIAVQSPRVSDDCGGHPTGQPAQRGMLGGIAGAVGTMLLKQATLFAANQASSLLARRSAP